MTRDSGGEQSQRTVAELLAQHGGTPADGSRRRRRRAADDDGPQPGDTAPQAIIDRVTADSKAEPRMPRRAAAHQDSGPQPRPGAEDTRRSRPPVTPDGPPTRAQQPPVAPPAAGLTRPAMRPAQPPQQSQPLPTPQQSQPLPAPPQPSQPLPKPPAMGGRRNGAPPEPPTKDVPPGSGFFPPPDAPHGSGFLPQPDGPPHPSGFHQQPDAPHGSGFRPQPPQPDAPHGSGFLPQPDAPPHGSGFHPEPPVPGRPPRRPPRGRNAPQPKEEHTEQFPAISELPSRDELAPVDSDGPAPSDPPAGLAGWRKRKKQAADSGAAAGPAGSANEETMLVSPPVEPESANGTGYFDPPSYPEFDERPRFDDMPAADERPDDYDEYDDEPVDDASPAKQWLMMAGQLALGVVGGAAVWLAFNWLWGKFPAPALIAAVIVTAGLVWIVRKIRRAEDLQTTVLAVLVGLVVTVSPAALLLVSR